MFLSCSYRWEGLAGSAPSPSQVWKMLQSANQAKRFAACCTAGRSQVFFIASITCVVSILAAALFSSFSRSQRPQGCNKGFKVGLVSWLALLVAQWSSIPSLDPSPKTALPPLSQVPVCISPYLPTSGWGTVDNGHWWWLKGEWKTMCKHCQRHIRPEDWVLLPKLLPKQPTAWNKLWILKLTSSGKQSFPICSLTVKLLLLSILNSHFCQKCPSLRPKNGTYGGKIKILRPLL